MHEGHRKRMIERLRDGEQGFQDHELLEVLLYNAIPRKNTNEIAHALLSSFQTISGVFEAGYEQLLQVDGVGEATAAYLRCVALLFGRAQDSRRTASPSAFNYKNFSAFVTDRFAGLGEEVVELYAIDGRGNVKSVSRLTSNEADRAEIKPSDVARFLVAASPVGLVVAHNHLCANCTPSAQDDRFTEQIQMLCSMQNIRFYDHVIVSEREMYSYFISGRLSRIQQTYNVEAVFGGERRHEEE